MVKISVRTPTREILVDITKEVQRAVHAHGLQEGICTLYTPHTTAALLIQENADPSVGRDLVAHLRRLFPKEARYEHDDGNADAHMKASLIGTSTQLFVEGGTLCLGTWQGIFLAEFDGPRTRQVWIKFQG